MNQEVIKVLAKYCLKRYLSGHRRPIGDFEIRPAPDLGFDPRMRVDKNKTLVFSEDPWVTSKKG